MNDAQIVRTSKFLAKHLRHAPEALGLQLAPGGWVEVEALLAACAAAGLRLTRSQLEEVVARNDKQRFSFDAEGRRIRANQGHSTEVDLQLSPVEPPPLLYHGTPERTAPTVEQEGLKKMRRHHVHLSPDVETAARVGQRRGRPVVFTVDAAAMHAAGHLFYRSENGVWLVDAVPPEFLRRRPG
jgi:putative RNA 2'-phosphotransferase